MTKRYTIEFSIKTVDEEGDTYGQEIEGCTMDYADEDLDRLTGMMNWWLMSANDAYRLNPRFEGVTPRRPEEEEEEEDDETLHD